MDGVLASPGELLARLVALLVFLAAIAWLVRRARRRGGAGGWRRDDPGSGLRRNMERMREDAPFRKDEG
jgi:hypothetical protein